MFALSIYAVVVEIFSLELFIWKIHIMTVIIIMIVSNLCLSFFIIIGVFNVYLAVFLAKIFKEGVKLIFIHVTVSVLRETESGVNINRQTFVTAAEETRRHATLPSFPIFATQTLATPHAMFSRERLKIRALRIGFAQSMQWHAGSQGAHLVLWRYNSQRNWAFYFLQMAKSDISVLNKNFTMFYSQSRHP